MASPLRLHGGKLIMKHISITYHMSREGEIAETCIILPMEDQIASDILEHQEESRHVREDGCGTIAVRTILTCLAELQGYTDASFCMATEVDLWVETELPWTSEKRVV